jgi:uncharacterized membrane protein
MRRLGLAVAVALAALVAAIGPATVSADDGTVRAVLFYSPSCPHCHQVLTVDLPVIQDRFGERLEVATVDVSREGGARLYESFVNAFDVPGDRLGVPTLVIGDAVLVGSLEIPAYLPGLVEDGLARGGTDWPPIPGLAEALATPAIAMPSTPPDDPATPSSSASATPARPDSDPGAGTGGIDLSPAAVAERYARDPLGNTLSILVLIVLALSIARAVADLQLAGAAARPAPSAWIAAAALVGLAAAVYLSVVELTSGTAVCGPVGDCNAVHASDYARILGVPVGLLGVVGYVLILGCWLLDRVGPATAARSGHLMLFLLALGGTIFSAYLTFLEPFVIGATCGWCLLSAMTMAAILHLAPRPGLERLPSTRAGIDGLPR